MSRRPKPATPPTPDSPVRVPVPGWTRRREVLRRTFEFADFVAALRFVNAVGRAAERAGHHPDIDLRWNRVTLALTTHDEGRLTSKDVALAGVCNRIAEAQAKRSS